MSTPHTPKDDGRADQLIGKAKQAMGKVKETAGNALGDDKMEANGRADRLEGTKDEAKGDAKQFLDKAGDKLREGAEKAKATAEVIGERMRGKPDAPRH